MASVGSKRALFAAALGFVAAIYIVAGSYTFLSGNVSDLHKRWLEQAYVAQGTNPLQVYDEPALASAELGPIHPGAYPPWSLFTGFVLVPPIRFPLARIWFGLLCWVSLAWIGAWAWRVAANENRELAGLAAAAGLAVFGHAVCLRLGQYSIVVTALVIGAAAFERSRPWLSGLLLGMATVKPNISGLFGLMLLFRGGLVPIAGASIYFAVATSSILLWLNTGLFHMLGQWYRQAGEWDGGDSGLIGVMLALGVPRAAATAAGLALGVGGGSVLFYRYRRHSVLVCAAIAAVLGRLWMYHRRYDDLMLVLLLVPLIMLAARRPTRLNLAAALLVGVSLWTPMRLADTTTLVVAAKVSTWLAGLWVLLRGSEPERIEADDLAERSRWAGLWPRRRGGRCAEPGPSRSAV